MTLDEKISLIQGQGMFTGPCAGTTPSINGSVMIPEICMQDGPAGLREVDDFVTGFPAGISVAATWNRTLMQQRGIALGEEWKAKGAHVFLGPAMDVTRSPQGGRSWESFGADSYINGEAAYETIKGVQSAGVQACAKHLIGYHQEHARFDTSVEIDERTLREVYFKPFQRAIEAEVVCVMCSYNKLKNKWACKDPALIGPDGLLRKEGGFQGYVVSDWGATHDGAVRSSEVHETVDAGLDVEMPGGNIVIGGGVYRNLKRAVDKRTVTEAAVDTMAIRFLSAWFKVNQDTGFPGLSFNVNDKTKNRNVNVRSDQHTALTRQIGAASVVLLSNKNNILPLTAPPSLAIVGVDADKINGEACSMNACDFKGTVPIGWGSGTNSLAHVVAPFQAITAYIQQTSSKTQLSSSLSQNLDEAKRVATQAQVAIVFVYTFSGEIGIGFSSVQGNFGDRNDLKVYDKGDELVKAVASVNSKTIVVIHSVGSVVIEEWAEHPNITAILMAGLPGEQTGPAITDILFGKVNPSGRLPFTMAKDQKDFGVEISPYNPLPFGHTTTVVYNEGLFTDYKRFDQLNITPRFPFGHGLSYTIFTYSNLRIVKGTKEEPYQITVSVTNVGQREGTEVAQLYLGFPPGAGEPPKLLRGFEAVPIAPAQKVDVRFTLKLADLLIYDTTKATWVQPPGSYKVFVGASSRDIRLESSF
ncbi:hypothetical protein PCANC_13629 [Puccinia coronata f. sp. avenae]|nr:hypothetical protein PCANC_22229 [Puccinia coronata f. sp. avenae]PLW38204.1 hypothetical protein PCANC_13629 [Puccinia coronata f. sp. avenae]